MPPPGYHVRPASAAEIPALVEMAAAAQDTLTRAGSVQQIAGYTRQNAEARVERGEMYMLEHSDRILGSAFMEPVTPERFSQISAWNAVPAGYCAWFLYGLVISPDFQGHGLGRVLLDGICRPQTSAAPAVLLLDCWAGNAKLRQFYRSAGFEFLGEFPEEDYNVAVFRRQIKAGPTKTMP